MNKLLFMMCFLTLIYSPGELSPAPAPVFLMQEHTSVTEHRYTHFFSSCNRGFTCESMISINNRFLAIATQYKLTRDAVDNILSLPLKQKVMHLICLERALASGHYTLQATGKLFIINMIKKHHKIRF